jgi:diguanylate cyclase (GGDEF)-like protein/PAS domain S-box-containing protein
MSQASVFPAADAAANDEHLGRLGSFVEAIDLPIGVWDAELRLVWCNPAAERWAGRRLDGAHGKTYREIFGDAVADIAEPWYRKALAGQAVSYDREVPHPSGVPRWHRVQVKPGRDAQGRVTHVFSVAMDIDADVRLREALRQSEARVSRILEAIDLPIGRWVAVDEEVSRAQLTYCNPPYTRWARKPADQLLGKTLDELYGEEAWRAAQPSFTRAYAGERAEYDRLIRHQEREHWMRVTVFPDIAPDGRVTSVYTVAFDIDDEKRAIEELRESRKRLDVFTANIPNSLTYFDKDYVYRFVSKAFMARYDKSPQDIIGRHVWEARGREVWEEYRPLAERAMAGEEVVFERPVPQKDGSLRWTRMMYTPDFDEHGQVVGVYSTRMDIHDIKLAQEALRHAAESDPLTDACNRRTIMHRIDAALAQAHERPFTLYFMDLDGFKAINDNAGHDAGDCMLIHVAQQLRRVVGVNNLLARFGGDEFLVLGWDTQPAQVRAMAQALVQAAAEPMRYDGQSLQVSVSVGVVGAPQPGVGTAVQLVRLADRAMYAAKRSGKNQWHVHDAARGG